MPKLDDVFGIATKPVLSYVNRTQVDDKFREAIDGHQHIVIYGSSKQGKTALRQKHLDEDKSEVVRCGPRTKIETIYQHLLLDAGIKLEVVETVTETTSGGAKAKWGFKALIPWIGGTDAEGEVTAGVEKQRVLQSAYVGRDLGDAQAIIDLLLAAKFKKFVVLENFHYLPSEVQQQLAFDLKAFHEVGIRFIVLGIWKEANLLSLHNGDLEGRITEIPVEPWAEADFDKVIQKGSAELNITIAAEVCQELKQNAHGNIGLLQEFLKRICSLAGVSETVQPRRDIAGLAESTLRSTVEEKEGRLQKVLEGIASKSRVDSEDPLILPYYLAQVILTAPLDELQNGMRRQSLLDHIKALHHRTKKDTIRSGDITHLMKRLPALQEDVQPPFLYYDSNQKTLKIVDATQLFVLSRVDREGLREEIPNPLEKYD